MVRQHILLRKKIRCKERNYFLQLNAQLTLNHSFSSFKNKATNFQNSWQTTYSKL